MLDGRYRLQAVVGQGAQGTTFRASGPSGDVAIKELAVGRAQDAGQRARLQREAEILGQLTHPAIPRLHETFLSGVGRGCCLYVVQDLVDGEDLERWIQGHRSSEAEVLALLVELCDILIWLHGRSPPVLHRDLKPANVVRGPAGRLHLVDFGSVREALRDPDLGGSTTAGTFGYMAPEQLVGDASPQSDLYGLGALAVRLLTRQQPASLLDRVGRMDWRRHATVSADTAALLDALLSPEADSRPASAAALKIRLEHILGGEGAALVLSSRPPAARLPEAAASPAALSGSADQAAGLLQRSLNCDGELVPTAYGFRWVDLAGRVAVDLVRGPSGLQATPHIHRTALFLALTVVGFALAAAAGLGGVAWMTGVLVVKKIIALELMALMMAAAVLATPVLSHLGRRRRVAAALQAAGAQVVPARRERVSGPLEIHLADQSSDAQARLVAGHFEQQLGLAGELRPLGAGWRWRSSEGGRKITLLVRPLAGGQGAALTVDEDHRGLAGGLFGGFVGGAGLGLGIGVGMPLMLFASRIGGLLWMGIAPLLCLLLAWLLFNRVRRAHFTQLRLVLEGLTAPVASREIDT